MATQTATSTRMKAYKDVFQAAEKYMRVRKNDVHIPISFHYAMRLADRYPDADRLLVGVAIILHDIGWYSIDEEDIFKINQLNHYKTLDKQLHFDYLLHMND